MRCTNQTGFSLLELLLVTNLILIIVASVPLFSSFMDTYQLTTAAQNIGSELQVAKYLAVSGNDHTKVNYIDNNGRDVTSNVPPVTDPQGRMIYVQGVVRGVRIVNASGKPLRADLYLPAGVTFASLPDNPIRFGSRGGSTTGAGATGSSTMGINNSTGNIDISVAPIGGRIAVIDRRGY